MAKKLRVLPVEPIILEFADGTEKGILLTAKTVAIIDDEFEGVSKMLLSGDLFETGCKVMYAGMKTYGEDIKYEEVQVLATKMPWDILQEIINDFVSSINKKGMDKNMTEEQKKIMKEILTSFQKK